MFQIGDIVEKTIPDSVFSNGSKYGKVIGFSKGTYQDAWVQIEGEYYHRNGRSFINYHNPMFLRKSSFEVKKFIKPFNFQLTDSNKNRNFNKVIR